MSQAWDSKPWEADTGLLGNASAVCREAQSSRLSEGSLETGLCQAHLESMSWRPPTDPFQRSLHSQQDQKPPRQLKALTGRR